MDRHSIAQFNTANAGAARKFPDLSLPHNGGLIDNRPRPPAPCGELIDLLRSRRQKLGWSLQEVADRCGIEPQSLGEWERGVAMPRFDAALHWAAALGLHVALLPKDSEARHGLRVDWQGRRVTVDGSPVRLTPMEWKALERLARTPGEVVTHQALHHHLYGEDRSYRAQSTAVRVLITKLRRLLPLRIEAQWGKGYVVSGIAPAPAPGCECDDGSAAGSETFAPQPEPAVNRRQASPQPASITVPAPRAAAAAVARDAVVTQARMPRAAPPPLRASCRAEELGVIERFLAERGATRCPDVATIQHSPLPTLVWDKVKRKWVRPTTCQAV